MIFIKSLINNVPSDFPVLELQHPAEQHLTNLYASLPKAIMLAGCIDHKSCSALFDEPVTP
jgi:hypothetical protein